MQRVSDSQLATVSGGIDEGSICGAMVAATIGSWVLFGPLAGSLVFMFAPSACALDYGF